MITTYLYFTESAEHFAVHDIHSPASGYFLHKPHDYETEHLTPDQARSLFSLLETRFASPEDAFPEDGTINCAAQTQGHEEVPDIDALLEALENIEWEEKSGEGKLSEQSGHSKCDACAHKPHIPGATICPRCGGVEVIRANGAGDAAIRICRHCGHILKP